MEQLNRIEDKIDALANRFADVDTRVALLEQTDANRKADSTMIKGAAVGALFSVILSVIGWFKRGSPSIAFWLAVSALCVTTVLAGCHSLGTAPVGLPGPPTAHGAGEQIASLQTWFFWIGLILAPAGLLAFLFAFFLSARLGDFTDYFRSGGAAAGLTGVGLLGVSIFAKAFAWCLGIGIALAVLGGILWVWLHRSDILPWLGKAAYTKAQASTGSNPASP